MLCADCEQLEIWGSELDDMTGKHFCPSCSVDPLINPWGEQDRRAGLDELLSVVKEHEQDAKVVEIAM